MKTKKSIEINTLASDFLFFWKDNEGDKANNEKNKRGSAAEWKYLMYEGKSDLPKAKK